LTIHDELTAELREAMKAKDKPKVNVIRQIETEVAVARSAPGFSGDVDDDLYRRVITSYVKKMDKARVEYEGVGDRGRDQAEKLAYEVEYLSRWLPETLGEEETRTIVRDAIAELGATDVNMMGRVIGHVMKSGAEVDGALVSRVVGEELG
jgi:uncharacterized protein YqeY